jgi:ribosomal protein S27E
MYEAERAWRARINIVHCRTAWRRRREDENCSKGDYMSSIRCPHCGFVSFSSAVTCKRCNKVLATSGASSGTRQPRAVSNKSSFRFQSDYPLISWALTFILLITNASLSYAVSRKSTTDPSEALGAAIGGVLAWPLILLIIYCVSKKFRERYSLHTVINCGLALNSIIQSTMVLG